MTDAPDATATPAGDPAPADRLLDAALTHVPFDGWSEATFRAAIADSGLEDSDIVNQARHVLQVEATTHREATCAVSS